MEAQVMPLRAPMSQRERHKPENGRAPVAARPLKGAHFEKIARERPSKDAARRGSLRHMLLGPHVLKTQQSPVTGASRRSSVSSGGSKLSPQQVDRVRRESIHDLQDPDLDLSLTAIEQSAEKLAVQREHQERNRLSLSVGARRSSGLSDMLLQCNNSGFVDQKGNRVRVSLSDDDTSPLSQGNVRTLRKNRLSLISSEAHTRARAASAETASSYARARAASGPTIPPAGSSSTKDFDAVCLRAHTQERGGPKRSTSLTVQLKNTTTPGGPSAQAAAISPLPEDSATTVFPANDHIPNSPRTHHSLQIIRMKSETGREPGVAEQGSGARQSLSHSPGSGTDRRASGTPRGESRNRSSTLDTSQSTNEHTQHQHSAKSASVPERRAVHRGSKDRAISNPKPKAARLSGGLKHKSKNRGVREEKKG